MVIDPKIALEEGWLTSPDISFDREKQLQPNGIDLRINKVAWQTGKLSIGVEGVEQYADIIDIPLAIDRYHLFANKSYEGTAYEYVKVPEGVIALIIHRSTFNRNGVFITGSIYDSGFVGYCGFSIRPSINIEVQRGTRVAQIVFFRAEGESLYSGQYQDKVDPTEIAQKQLRELRESLEESSKWN